MNTRKRKRETKSQRKGRKPEDDDEEERNFRVILSTLYPCRDPDS